ncbi:MAG TPA: TusE/DsrC/DsvC family sulfur relay protein [Gallionellaceae bacterium]
MKYPEYDQDGFLLDPLSWDEDLARSIAAEEGLIDLDEDHWAIIHFLRDHYVSGGLPAVSHVCHVNRLDDLCMTDMFQSVRSAWRIAGLPNPGEEAKAYM